MIYISHALPDVFRLCDNLVVLRDGEVVGSGETKSFSTEKLVKIALFSTERSTTDIYCFEPGQSQKPHTHAGSDKVYVVLEGRANVKVGAEEKLLTAGQTALAPAGEEHGITNPGAERMICLVFISPPPK